MTEPIGPLDFAVDAVAGPDGAVRVVVAGELDIASAPEFLAAVRPRLGERRVVVDLGGVTFLDSSGVRALHTLSRESTTLEIARDMSPAVVQVLELTGMLDLLPLAPA